MKRVFFVFIAILIGCMSCQKEKAASGSSIKIKGSNIVDAHALGQAQVSNGRSSRASQAEGLIFKLDANGELSDLIIYAENYQGEVMPCQVVAETIQNLSDEFVLLSSCYFIFPDGFFHPDENAFAESVSLLMRKSSGAVYKIPVRDFSVMQGTDICTDRSNAIYFINQDGMVMKLSAVDDEVSISQISSTEFRYRSLAVDRFGNIAVSTYQHTGTDPNNNSTSRSGFHSFGHIYFAAGGVKPVELSNAYRGFFSFDGEFAAISYELPEMMVNHLKIEGLNLSWEQKASCQRPEGSIGISDQDLAITCKNRFITTNDLTVTVDEINETKTMLLVYDGNSFSYKIEDAFPKGGYYNSKAYYVIDGFRGVSGTLENPVGDGAIFKYDFETLIGSTKNYDINLVPPMIVSGTEVLILDNTCKFLQYGVRQSDAQPIMVEINAETGSVSVTEYGTDRQIYNLVRLN